MVVIRDIEVTVQVDGQNLTEYDDDENAADSTSNSTTKYVQAISDARFAVFVKLLDSFKFASDALFFDICVDGVCVSRPLFMRQTGKRHDLLQGREEKEGQQRYLRPFYFADLPSREYIYRVHVIPAKPVTTVHQKERTEAEVEQFRKAQIQGIISVKAFNVKLLGQICEGEYRGCALDKDQEVGKKARVKTGLTHRSK